MNDLKPAPNKRRKRMILNDEQQKKLEELSRPVIEWLNDNFHPHVAVVITPASTELCEGVFYCPIDDYVKD
jgi:hypothetical protein